jgi:polysaccharide export outer membrane protein
MKSKWLSSAIRRTQHFVEYSLLLSLLGIPFNGTALSASESLLIGPGDQLHVKVADTPEMDQHPRVTDAGEVPIEGAGNVRVSGLTPAAAATIIQDQLIANHYMRHPAVTVTIEQYATQTVSVLGEVKAPGAYPITTPRSILDLLALAGGLSPSADRNIVVQRHSSPEDCVHYNYSNNADAAMSQQILVRPGDTIVVPKAGIVYVLGDVNRPGGFLMTNNDSKMTVLEVLALAGGVSKTAKQNHARLIRNEGGASYLDRQVSISDLQEGKTPDIAMQPGDVIYVPFSFGRNLAVYGAGSIAAAATSAGIYAVP